MKTYRAFHLFLIIVVMCAFYASRAYAAPPPQDNDPAEQCTEGLNLIIQEKYEEALPLLEAGFNGREKTNFADSEILGYCALIIGKYRASVGDSSGALEAYQVALPIFRASQNRKVEGGILNNLGDVYRSQGHYAKALDSYQQALVINREISDRAGEADTLNRLGMVYFYQDQYAQALEYYQQALVIHVEVGDRASEGAILHNLGRVYDAQGRYAQALYYYQQALAIDREEGDRTGEGSSLNNLGRVYDAQGQYAQALDYYQQSLAIRREVGDRAGEADTLNGLGIVYKNQGQYGQALDLIQKALTIYRELGDRLGEATTLNNLGGIYKDQTQYAQALDYYQQSLSIVREVGDRAREGATLNNIGLVYFNQNQFEQALDYYKQALSIVREVGNRAREGTTLDNLGLVYESLGQYEQALDYYKQALTISREVGDREGEGRTLSNLGGVYDAQGQYTQALDYYKQSIAVFEGLRAIAGNDSARTSFIAQYADLYQRAAFVAHQLQQDDQAFTFSEQGRARSFLDAITTGAMELSDQPTAELVAREQKTYASWLAAQEALAKAKAQNPPNNILIIFLEIQLADAEQAHMEALQAIEARGDELTALIPGRSTVLSLDEIQALLDDQTTLVSYLVIDNDPGALAFIITYNTFSVVELPNAKPSNLKTAVQGLFPSLHSTHPQPLQDLYTWLIAPIKDQIRTPQVGIIPHLTLHYVPFAALTDGKTYLGEQYQLFELPSASSLRYIQQNASQAKNSGAVVFGNPVTNETGLPILPYAEAEAEAVAQALGSKNYTGTNATELQLRESVSGKAVLHLAVHGSYNQFNPLFSTLYLAPDTQYDGRLEVHEIFGLDLKGSQLVVLSACETQLGQLSTGDEVVGMTRAFMFAGTPSVLASLWQVDDEATQVLMTAFYKHWREDGMNKAQALQAAQADVRANPKWESPYYWAAFVLNGDAGITSIQPVNELATEPVENVATQQPTSNPSAPICPSAMLAPVVFIVVFSTIKRRSLFK